MNKQEIFMNKIVDNCHVSESNIQVIKKVFRHLVPSSYWKADKEKRKAFLKAIIDRHENNFKTYYQVMTGRF